MRSQSYLNKSTYKLSTVSTTTVLKGHAFDCYVELLHNDITVARAFGEAKNYELLRGHLQTFEEWLKDVDFKSVDSDGHPPDLAFLIAPECPSLLQRKLELKKIKFIKADKVAAKKLNTKDNNENLKKNDAPELVIPIDEEYPKKVININTADKSTLISIFRGTGVKQATIDKLITYRQTKEYQDLNDLASNLRFTQSVRSKLQTKINNNEISFHQSSSLLDIAI